MKEIKTVSERFNYLLSGILFHTPESDSRNLAFKAGRLCRLLDIDLSDINGRFFIPSPSMIRDIPVDSINLTSGLARFSTPFIETEMNFLKGTSKAFLVGVIHDCSFTGSGGFFKAVENLPRAFTGAESGVAEKFNVPFTHDSKIPGAMILDASTPLMPSLSKDVVSLYSRIRRSCFFLNLGYSLLRPFKAPLDDMVFSNGKFDLSDAVEANFKTLEQLDSDGISMKNSKTMSKRRAEWYAIVERSAEQANTIESLLYEKTNTGGDTAGWFLMGAGHLPLVKYFLDHPKERFTAMLQTVNLVGLKLEKIG